MVFKGVKKYTHYDAVFRMPVHYYVINYKGKQLGLEFRKSENLGPVLETVYQSFSLTITKKSVIKPFSFLTADNE